MENNTRAKIFKIIFIFLLILIAFYIAFKDFSGSIQKTFGLEKAVDGSISIGDKIADSTGGEIFNLKKKNKNNTSSENSFGNDVSNRTDRIVNREGFENYKHSSSDYKDYSSDYKIVHDNNCRNCNPKCRWKCTEPIVNKQCKPNCKKPECHVHCSEPRDAVCNVNCKAPKCDIKCPTNAGDVCNTNPCQISCNKPECKVNCMKPTPKCEIVCGKPNCKWDCFRPTDTVKPKCKLICDNYNNNVSSNGLEPVIIKN